MDPTTEETPLLTCDSDIRNAVYLRFTPSRKLFLVAIVAFVGVLPNFVSGTFVPSIPQIEKDLDTTAYAVSMAVSLSVFAQSLGALTGATYSSFYGRRLIYLYSLPLLAIGSAGVALAQTVPELLFWRFFQAVGAAPGMSVGIAVIGDIYKLEERGGAMGLYFSVSLLGPALAPVAGGIATRYASWRIMQGLIGISALVAFFLTLLYFPETSHPGTRGVDKITSLHPTWRPVILNPLKPLWLLRSPNLFALTITGFTTLMTEYVLLIPVAYTIGARYNIQNEALIGACFAPCGLGNMIASPIAGRLSDRLVVSRRVKVYSFTM